jgi:Pyruvate/2-oxoacid:ferredoxin oxidoreductase delta subunit
MTQRRKIIKIDENRCDGCGLCAAACAENAIKIIDGKAKLVSETYCDGLGACVGECPRGALTVEERDCAAFSGPSLQTQPVCPGKAAFSFSSRKTASAESPAPDAPSFLEQWPVQLHLVPVRASFWDGADLLVCADCVCAAFGDFQGTLLRGRRLIMLCPKLDDTSGYLNKLAQIFAQNDIKSVTAARMEVPCCMGTVRLARAALDQAGKNLPFKTVTVKINGDIETETI